MTNRSHRPHLRAALRDDALVAGREALLARSFWATSAVGAGAEVLSFADAVRRASAGRAQHASLGRAPTP